MIILSLTDFLLDTAGDLSRSTRTLVDQISSSTLRLGVTGLSRSGKTVFITSLVNALTDQNCSPSLVRLQRLPGFQAYLEPQPDDTVPRFEYETHRAAILGHDRVWPESTKQISQLRITLEWDSDAGARSYLGLKQRLHLDIVDYPGEWLLDLSLLDQSYSDWSRRTLDVLKQRHEDTAAPLFDFLAETQSALVPGSSVSQNDIEQRAIEGHAIFTTVLQNVRNDAHTQAVIGPGRFLWPGDLAGTPQVTFFPSSFADEETEKADRASAQLDALLSRRYDAFKANVVKPFFANHFKRLDRQIVLVDALTPLNRGALAVRDLEDALHHVLMAMKPGANSWLSLISGKRIDRVLFAATKADHVHSSQHPVIKGILEKLITRAANKATDAGATTACLAVASLKATTDVKAQTSGDAFHCIRGIPENGEDVAGIRYDGTTEAVVFPGDLPRDVLDVFEPDSIETSDYDFVRFRPPILQSKPNKDSSYEAQKSKPWPHVGLDDALDFLIGDYVR